MVIEVEGIIQPKVDVRGPRWRPRSVAPKIGKESRNLKSTVVRRRMRGMVQTCRTVHFWEERNSPSENGGQISLKESPEEKLLEPKRIDQEND